MFSILVLIAVGYCLYKESLVITFNGKDPIQWLKGKFNV